MDKNWRFMRANISREEDERRQRQAEIKAKGMLRALYRQINLIANIQLLRSENPSSSALTESLIQRDDQNKGNAFYTLNMLPGVHRLSKKREKFSNIPMDDWPEWMKNQPDRWQIGYKTTQIRLARLWESMGRDTEMFAICAHALVFRGSAWKETPRVWSAFENLLKENFVSILAFAQTRRLEAKYLAHAVGAKAYPIMLGGRDVETLHPHQVVVNLRCQHLRQPVFDGARQKNIKFYIFNPDNWPLGTIDPTLRTPEDGRCDRCSSLNLCNCVYSNFSMLFLELVECGDGRGTGVRTLDNFAKGARLGAFLGEVLPSDSNVDPIYSLGLESKTRPGRLRAVISPRMYGNWARFVNHSCEPSVEFVSRTIGDRIFMMVEAKRDIAAFEELTIDYGSSYFERKQWRCLCGSDRCRDMDQPNDPRKPHPIPMISPSNPYRCWEQRPKNAEDQRRIWRTHEEVWAHQQRR